MNFHLAGIDAPTNLLAVTLEYSGLPNADNPDGGKGPIPLPSFILSQTSGKVHDENFGPPILESGNKGIVNVITILIKFMGLQRIKFQGNAVSPGMISNRTLSGGRRPAPRGFGDIL